MDYGGKPSPRTNSSVNIRKTLSKDKLDVLGKHIICMLMWSH